MILALIIGISLVASFALTLMVRRFALRHGIVDRPNLRSSHETPTPRGGGAAIVAATVFGIAVTTALHLTSRYDAVVIGVGLVGVAFIGWLDDRHSIRPSVRLSVHFAAAIWTVVALGGLPSISTGRSAVHLGLFGSVAAVVATVWSINLFNFMDGIDGLAGSEGALVFVFGAAMLYVVGDASLAAIASVAAAACTGFLAWNWPPARIFMGDVGSGAIGYLIAALALASEKHGSVPLLAWVIAYGVFVADATVTLTRRLAHGERAADAHRDHAYQRLSRAWRGHRPVTLCASATTALLALLAAIGTAHRTLLPAALAAAAVLLAALILLVERRAPLSASARRGEPPNGLS